MCSLSQNKSLYFYTPSHQYEPPWIFKYLSPLLYIHITHAGQHMNLVLFPKNQLFLSEYIIDDKGPFNKFRE